MATLLRGISEMDTCITDFQDELNKAKYYNKGLECVFAFAENGKLKLVPLQEFKCKRMIPTLHYDVEDLELYSSFGVTGEDDFLQFKLSTCEFYNNTDGDYQEGYIISKNDDLYNIFADLCESKGFIKDRVVQHSFVLHDTELNDLILVPFKLQYLNGKFIVTNIKDKITYKEYNDRLNELYTMDCQL